MWFYECDFVGLIWLLCVLAVNCCFMGVVVLFCCVVLVGFACCLVFGGLFSLV